MRLEESDKKELLRVARSSIESSLSKKDMRFRTESPFLLKPQGAFVTLRIDQELRGCIGYVEAHLPLIDTVAEAAVKAALQDPRFPPLTSGELSSVQIEISVLSPLSKVVSPDTIQVGIHGLVIDDGFTRGLLLPGVAVEYHWTREEFLDHTAVKAGLAPDAWRSGRAKIFSFTTETFSESSVPQLH